MSLPKEELHRMIDALPENKINKAKQILEKLLDRKTSEERWAELLANPVFDDEPWTDEDEKDWREGMEDIANGSVKSWGQVKKELNI